MMRRAFTVIIFLALLSGPEFTQSTAAPPAFEAADVHVSPHRLFPFMDGGILRGDRYVLRQATMVDLIASAYGVDTAMCREGPSGWKPTGSMLSPRPHPQPRRPRSS